MLSKTLLSAAALLTSVAAIETHGGVDFEVFYTKDAAPETEPIKDMYQGEAAKQAATRLHTRISEKNYKTTCFDVEANKGTDLASLTSLKECLVKENDQVFFELLAEDIAEGEAFWEKVVAESTAPRTEWISAKSYLRCYFDGELTAEQFAAWLGSPAADASYLGANAEHYGKRVESIGPLEQVWHITEGWGGVLSSGPVFGNKIVNFTVPDFKPQNFGVDPDYPAEWAISSKFGYLQRAGPKTLPSGTTWAVLHMGARNIEASEGTTGKAGMEIYGAVWYPPWDLSSEQNQEEFKAFLKDEDLQVVAEVVSFTLQARDYCAKNNCTVALPGSGK